MRLPSEFFAFPTVYKAPISLFLCLKLNLDPLQMTETYTRGDTFEASSYSQDAALDFAKARCRQSEGMNIKWNVEWVRPPRLVHARAFPARALDPDPTSCAQVVLKMETRQVSAFISFVSSLFEIGGLVLSLVDPSC